MTSPLSTDQIAQLTPLLGSLARMVAGGSSLSSAEMDMLWMGASLGAEPPILEELQRWGRLLRTRRANPSLELRRAAVEGLLLRGLPEAPVMLAVNTVAVGAVGDAAASPPAVSRLTASVASLDVGTLPAGQSGVREFEVTGGPGQVVVDSDQVAATPTQFGAEPTRIRVEVCPGGGSLLWAPLKLVSVCETVEVPVIAQWAQPAPVVIPPPPVATAPQPAVPSTGAGGAARTRDFALDARKLSPAQSQQASGVSPAVSPAGLTPRLMADASVRQAAPPTSPATAPVAPPRAPAAMPARLSGSPWLEWFAWTAMSSLGGVAAWLTTSSLRGPFTGPPLLVAAVVLGLAQWFVLHHQLRSAAPWVVVTGAGLIAGSSSLLTLPYVDSLILLRLSPVIGLIVGIAQWLYLRRHLQQAGWWVLASVIGFGLWGWVLWQRHWSPWDYTAVADYLISQATIVSAVTGVPLVLLRRK